MKISQQIFSFLLLFFLSNSSVHAFSCANEGYDRGCLDVCFRTGHDCNYCNYHCYKYPRDCGTPNYDGDTVCPFFPVPDYGQDNNYM